MYLTTAAAAAAAKHNYFNSNNNQISPVFQNSAIYVRGNN